MNDHRSMHSGHLNDDQFAAIALGMETSADATAHVAQCAECSAELAKFGATITEFSSAALGWSEAHSPLSMRQVTRQAVAPRPKYVVATWAALTAGVLLAVGGSMISHKQAVADSPSNVADTTADSETEIAQDNKLMRDVSLAIGQGVPSPEREYGLRPTAVRARPRVESRSQ